MKKRNAYKIKNTKDLFKKLKISKEILSKKQKNNLHCSHILDDHNLYNHMLYQKN